MHRDYSPGERSRLMHAKSLDARALVDEIITLDGQLALDVVTACVQDFVRIRARMLIYLSTLSLSTVAMCFAWMNAEMTILPFIIILYRQILN